MITMGVVMHVMKDVTCRPRMARLLGFAASLLVPSLQIAAAPQEANPAYDAQDARLKVDLVNDHLAGKEMQIGRFYERSGRWLAAQIRFQIVVDKYQTTSHTPEALYRLTETNLALGIPSEAKKYAAVLGSNYPGSEWYQKAYELIGDKAPQLKAS